MRRSFSVGKWLAVLCSCTAFLLSACSDDKPSKSDALSQIQASLEKGGSFTIQHLQYVNGFPIDKNNYIVSVTFTTVFKKSFEEFEGGWGRMALGWKYGDVKRGDVFDETGDAHFLKTEKGWVFQDWKSSPTVIRRGR